MITSEALHEITGLQHAFGTREDPVPLGRERSPLWKQVHGADAAEARAPGQALGDVDAIWAATPAVTIGVVTADCVPILLAHRSGARVAAIHAGWRGTRARIVRRTWAAIAAAARPLGMDDPGEWVAAIGPAISSCCYEVSEELAADFAREFGAYALPAPRMLDLPIVNEAELRAIGIGQIDRLSFCTKCSRDSRGRMLFYSYRDNPGEGRQHSQIRASAPRSG